MVAHTAHTAIVLFFMTASACMHGGKQTNKNYANISMVHDMIPEDPDSWLSVWTQNGMEFCINCPDGLLLYLDTQF